MSEHRVSDSDRLSKLEAIVESLARSVKEDRETHAAELRNINIKLDTIGKPNYQGLGVLVASIVALGSMAAWAVNGPIKNNSTMIAVNKEEVTGRMDRIQDQLKRQIDHEIERNNWIERELGGLLETNALFKAGLLRLGEKP